MCELYPGEFEAMEHNGRMDAIESMHYPQVEGITPTVVAGLCDDCISRQEAIDAINEYGSVWMEYTDSMTVDEIADRALKASKQSMHKIIHDLPSVTPKSKTGHWIDDEFGSKCSCCDIYTHLDKFDRPMKFKHCSMCGAKMVETQESEE